MIISMLPSTAEVREVYLGESGIAKADGGVVPALLIECSTIDPRSSREIADATQRIALHRTSRPFHGCSAAHPAMIDAPVSGGVTGASAATLTFMVMGHPVVVLLQKAMNWSLAQACILDLRLQIYYLGQPRQTRPNYTSRPAMTQLIAECLSQRPSKAGPERSLVRNNCSAGWRGLGCREGSGSIPQDDGQAYPALWKARQWAGCKGKFCCTNIRQGWKNQSSGLVDRQLTGLTLWVCNSIAGQQ